MDQVDFFTTNDGISIRYGIWRSRQTPVRGTVMLLGGRKEFLEKYAETIGDLNRRRYDVCSFDWRGQGLSTRLLADRLKGHVGRYEDYLKDLNQFYLRVIAPMGGNPPYLLAHSMGAHIALRYLHDHPERFSRAVLTAPMIDIHLGLYPRWLVRGMIRWASKFNRAESYVPGGRIHSQINYPFEGNKLTSDPIRYQFDKKAISANHDLALGGVTFGWLAATFESIQLLNRPGYAEQIAVPLLMVAAGQDRIVSTRAFQSLYARMPACRAVELEGSRHEILMERDPIRNRFWALFDEFLS